LVLYPGESRAVAFERREGAERIGNAPRIEHFAQFQ